MNCCSIKRQSAMVESGMNLDQCAIRTQHIDRRQQISRMMWRNFVGTIGFADSPVPGGVKFFPKLTHAIRMNPQVYIPARPMARQRIKLLCKTDTLEENMRDFNPIQYFVVQLLLRAGNLQITEHLPHRQALKVCSCCSWQIQTRVVLQMKKRQGGQAMRHRARA